MQHILLIEDDALVALGLSMTLKQPGSRVSHATNGQEGIDDGGEEELHASGMDGDHLSSLSDLK